MWCIRDCRPRFTLFSNHNNTEGWTAGAGSGRLTLRGNASSEFVTVVGADNATTLAYSFFTFAQEQEVTLGMASHTPIFL